MRYYLIAAATVLMISIGIIIGFSTIYDFLNGGSPKDSYPVTGTLLIKLKDLPKEWGDATHVYVHYGAITIHRTDQGNESGWHQVITGDEWIDLRDVLTSPKAIGNGSVQSGDYNMIRIEIQEAMVTVNGVNETAFVQSGKLTIGIPKGGIKIKAWQTTCVVIDIMPKVVWKLGNYMITPTAKAYVEG